MARFDVNRQSDGSFLLDCQADILRDLNTRFVVPLLPPELAPRAAARLNPLFDIRGESVVMYTQFASSVPARELGAVVISLADEHSTIMDALDMLITGY